MPGATWAHRTGPGTRWRAAMDSARPEAAAAVGRLHLHGQLPAVAGTQDHQAALGGPDSYLVAVPQRAAHPRLPRSAAAGRQPRRDRHQVDVVHPAAQAGGEHGQERRVQRRAQVVQYPLQASAIEIYRAGVVHGQVRYLICQRTSAVKREAGSFEHALSSSVGRPRRYLPHLIRFGVAVTS